MFTLLSQFSFRNEAFNRHDTAHGPCHHIRCHPCSGYLTGTCSHGARSISACIVSSFNRLTPGIHVERSARLPAERSSMTHPLVILTLAVGLSLGASGAVLARWQGER